MKKILAICCVLFFVTIGFAADTKEVLLLKRDLAQERISRIRTELELMKAQYREGQEALTKAGQELDKFNDAIKALPKETAK